MLSDEKVPRSPCASSHPSPGGLAPPVPVMMLPYLLPPPLSPPVTVISAIQRGLAAGGKVPPATLLQPPPAENGGVEKEDAHFKPNPSKQAVHSSTFKSAAPPRPRQPP